MEILKSGGGALIFSFYIILDTQVSGYKNVGQTSQFCFCIVLDDDGWTS